ncbi:hypothetical protein [Sphingomonas pokkalii]|nr:hypothetical protein [Sphingomonas pokkalii]
MRRFNRRAFDHIWTMGFADRRPPAPDLVEVTRTGPSMLYRVVRSSH